MKESQDSFKTLRGPSGEVLFKDQKSKFFGYAYPIENETQVKPIINDIKAKYPAANHVCYAWQLGVEKPVYRANDDGEPSNSAGMPIYRQLQSFEVTNVLVAVARVFGGTKLGVGGLINAYRSAARMALQNAKIIEQQLQNHFLIVFDYAQMNRVMRVIKAEQLQVLSLKQEMKCELTISVRQKEAEKVLKTFQAFQNIEIEILA